MGNPFEYLIKIEAVFALIGQLFVDNGSRKQQHIWLSKRQEKEAPRKTLHFTAEESKRMKK